MRSSLRAHENVDDVHVWHRAGRSRYPSSPHVAEAARGVAAERAQLNEIERARRRAAEELRASQNVVEDARRRAARVAALEQQWAVRTPGTPGTAPKQGTLRARPALDSEQRDFVAFLASIDLQRYAKKLWEEQITCIADLQILNDEDLEACGIPPEAAKTMMAGLADLGPSFAAAPRGSRAIVSKGAEESKASNAAAPPPPGKVLVDEILDDAAARAAALETSLTAHQTELKRLKSVLKDRGVPDGYLCPISLEVMAEPVIAADGHSYEKREIEAWFARGNNTSPKTGATLPHQFLTPNHNLKSAIQDFLAEVRPFAEM